MTPNFKHLINPITKQGGTLVATGPVDDLVFIRNTLNIWNHVPNECMLLTAEAGTAHYYVANEYIDWNEYRRIVDLNLETRQLPQHMYKPYTHVIK